jgi:hypothetical protein
MRYGAQPQSSRSQPLGGDFADIGPILHYVVIYGSKKIVTCRTMLCRCHACQGKSTGEQVGVSYRAWAGYSSSPVRSRAGAVPETTGMPLRFSQRDTAVSSPVRKLVRDRCEGRTVRRLIVAARGSQCRNPLHIQRAVADMLLARNCSMISGDFCTVQ